MRNLTNGGEDVNVVITNRMEAVLPLEQTQADFTAPILISLKGLTAMGSVNQIMKVNSNNELAWATDNNEIITTTLPLLKTNSDISLKGITAFGGAGKILKVNSNNDAFEWATETDTTYSGTAPIVITGNVISYNKDTLLTFTQKTFGDLTGFNNSLSVKATATSNSGSVRFYEASINGTNFIDLHTQGHTLTSSINVFLPNSVDNTVLVGRNTEDTLTNKTFSELTMFSAGLSCRNGDSSSGYIRLYENGATSDNFIDIIAPNSLEAANYTLTLPSESGVLGVANGTIAFGDGGGTAPIERSYIFDPRQNSGDPTLVYNVLSYHENGTESAINNWSAAEGELDSHFSINFAGAMKFRFHANGVLKVGSFSYTYPSTTGTLALTTDVIPYNYGGTGFTTYTQGDIIYASATNTLTKLSKGADGTVLKMNATVPYWGSDVNTNFFSKINTEIYATSTSDTLTLGKDQGLSNTYRLYVVGNSYFEGDLNVSNSLTVGTHHKLGSFTLTGTNYLEDPNSAYLQKQILTWNDASTVTGLWVSNSITGVVNLNVGSSTKLQCKAGGVDITGTLTTTGVINAGDHIQLASDDGGSTIDTHYIYDPNSTITTENWKMQWDTASYLTMVNCGSTNGQTILSVGGSGKVIANSAGGKVNGQLDVTGKLICVSNHLNIEYISSLTYFYNPEGTHTANNGGEATAAGSYISYHDNGSAIYFNIPNGATAVGNYISFATGNSQQMRIEMAGNLYVCGTVYDGTCPSDSRLKHNQKVYDKNATDILNKIVIKDFMKSQIINFDDKDPDDTSKGMKPFYERLCPMEDCKYDIGVIAQELYEIPELAFMVDTENWSEEKPATIPNWNPLISLLIKSNQEQQTELDTVKTELDTYKSIINKLLISPSFKSFKESLI